MLSCVAVTPTIGEPGLVEAIASVQRQDAAGVRHLIVVDGAAYEGAVRGMLSAVPRPRFPIDVLVLPRNTGGGGFNGHRIFAAIPYLIDEDVIFLLDADNLQDAEHVSSCLRALDWSGHGWCYSLRRFIMPDGATLFDDDGESLGFWKRYLGHRAGQGVLKADEEAFFLEHPYLVDTNCFAVRREVFMRHGSAWYYKSRGDAVFTTALIRNEPGVCTGRVSVSYRLKEQTAKCVAAFSQTANDFMRAYYGDVPLPWRAQGNEPGILSSMAGEAPLSR